MKFYCNAAVFTSVLLLALACRPSGAGDVRSDTWSAAECESLGFIKSIARCSDCETLQLHTGSAALTRECTHCCTTSEEGEKNDEKYTEARIEFKEMHRMLHGQEPNELLFFKQRYQQEPYFRRIRFIMAPRVVIPRIVLKNAVSGEEISVQIMYWDSNSIHEFLKSKLET